MSKVSASTSTGCSPSPSSWPEHCPALAGGLHAPLIMVDPQMGLEVLAFAFMIVIIGGLGSIKGTLVSGFLVGQVVSIGSLIYAPLAPDGAVCHHAIDSAAQADRPVRQPFAQALASVSDQIGRLPHVTQKPCPRDRSRRNHVACDKQGKSDNELTPPRHGCSHGPFKSTGVATVIKQRGHVHV